jgi:hypothetical protein
MTNDEILTKVDELKEERAILVSEMNDTLRWMHADGIEERIAQIDKELEELDREWHLNEAQFSSEYEDDGQPTEQQENEDFAHDDDWHNMSASDMI